MRDSNIKFWEGKGWAGAKLGVYLCFLLFLGWAYLEPGIFVAEERKGGTGSGWLALLVESIYHCRFLGVLSDIIGGGWAAFALLRLVSTLSFWRLFHTEGVWEAGDKGDKPKYSCDLDISPLFDLDGGLFLRAIVAWERGVWTDL